MNRTSARKVLVVLAVVVTGFLCGWRALGLTGGVVMGLALGGGALAAVGERDGGCSATIKRWRRRV